MPLVVLLCLALLVPALEAKERKGARLIITMNDGSIVRGELLAVMENDLVLMGEPSSNGVTVNLADVQKVKVIKRVNILKGLGIGLAAGAAGGAVLSAISYREPEPGEWVFFSGGESVLLGAIGFGVIGGLAGGIISAVNPRKTYVIGGKSAEETKEIAARLRKLAREQG